MERFIVNRLKLYRFFACNLKSSMERFIDYLTRILEGVKSAFKIQYGEIYREAIAKVDYFKSLFKIQYGEIYS